MGDEVRDRFEALAERSDGIVFVTDYAVQFLYASSALERETGFTVADFQMPHSDNPFIHRDDAARVTSELAAFISSDVPVSAPIENRFLDRWGRTHQYISTISKIEFGGAPALLFVSRPRAVPVHNIDDRQYRALVESADDAIVRLDARGRFLFANARTGVLLGYTAVELGRLAITDMVAQRDRGLLVVQLARATAAAHSIRFDIELVTSDGRVVPVQAVLTALGRFGQAGELLAILRDASPDHQVRAAQRLEMMGIVVAGIADDIKSELTSVTMNLAAARCEGQVIRAGLDDADRATEAASGLCTRLLACAATSATDMADVELDLLIGESVHLMRAAVTRRAALHVTLGGAPRIRGDSLQLRQVVMNLLVNASEAVEVAGSHVTIATGTRASGAACVTVSDDGAGMDEAVRARALDPFFTTKEAGRGLGLAAAAAIIRNHGGTLRLSSTPGGGTTVEVELPAIEPRAVAIGTREHAAPTTA